MYVLCLLQLKMAEVEYSGVLLCWLQERERRANACAERALLEEEERRRTVITNETKYQVRVERLWVWSCQGSILQNGLLLVNDLLSEEERQQQSSDSQQRNELSVTLQKWRATRRFFTGERGAWSCR